ncbi:MAG TPA: adenine phosphoribosyltransferase [Gemmatimonadota bacterium]|nr:adenine phosphoribosyltransferase [Gemmatimonadota bacterium]
MSGIAPVRADELADRLKKSIRDIPDFPKPGILFKDITPVLLDPALFRDAVSIMADWTKGWNAQKVLGVDARGFLFAGAVADRLGVGLVPARKPSKLPYRTVSESYDLEYGVNTLELHVDAIEEGERVVVVDDLLATGGTVKAATRLVESLGGTVAGLAFVIELGFLDGRSKLLGYDTKSLVTFD